MECVLRSSPWTSLLNTLCAGLQLYARALLGGLRHVLFFCIPFHLSSLSIRPSSTLQKFLFRPKDVIQEVSNMYLHSNPYAYLSWCQLKSQCWSLTVPLLLPWIMMWISNVQNVWYAAFRVVMTYRLRKHCPTRRSPCWSHILSSLVLSLQHLWLFYDPVSCGICW